MIHKITNRFKKAIRSALNDDLYKANEKNFIQIGRMKSDFNKIYQDKFKGISDFEFSIFSQSGEDGIIQHLVRNIEISNKFFIEFGVENYRECNTKFLLVNDNWNGLVFDASVENIESVKKSDIYYKYDLRARAEFITRENINELFKSENFSGEIGLLSIDIDGNDYWIWDAISVIQPIIVIIEYNSLFGDERYITIPYDRNFYRHNYHFSGLVYGASLPALVKLSESKGYSFVGSNSVGNNAFFVKNEYLGGLKTFTAKEGYMESKFKEARNEGGELTFLRMDERLNSIRGNKVFNILTNTVEEL